MQQTLRHLKMMRLLLLCLLLPTATVFSDEIEGSAFDGQDDEDSFEENELTEIQDRNDVDTFVDKTKGAEDMTDQFTLIAIIGGVSVLALSVAVIVAVMLVRRRMHKQQQGAGPERGSLVPGKEPNLDHTHACKSDSPGSIISL
ncbi:uncharacterized protein si:dkey-262k9.2 isoform X2 [Syngnathus typhle]|uniref:uncharacterized protein si:dkey-262k9.2 isoform X2 n=1 Tax=Syngnathus typhle TaxID=161592 RepID=UPI002A69F026|nr:uncharacterized protein si:dkey-262k9.2 isoform X2 [Syngnathus typhle]